MSRAAPPQHQRRCDAHPQKRASRDPRRSQSAKDAHATVSVDRVTGIDVLKEEFAGEEATFMTRLRIDLVWDCAAFTRLEQAMREVCAAFEDREELPRFLADGFYFASVFTRSWTAHPSFPRPRDDGYYRACLQRLDDLAW